MKNNIKIKYLKEKKKLLDKRYDMECKEILRQLEVEEEKSK